jgi:hypothetical protein
MCQRHYLTNVFDLNLAHRFLSGQPGVLPPDELLNLMEETLGAWRRRRQILVRSAGRGYASK